MRLLPCGGPMTPLAKSAARVAQKLGLTISRSSTLNNRLPAEASEADRQTISTVRPFTMTSAERLWSLLKSVDYVVQQPVAGDFVECGVWRGGSIMAMALRLHELGAQDRDLWLFDTFEGMTEPSGVDIEATSGKTAKELLDTTAVDDGDNVWCIASLNDVKANVFGTGYPQSAFHFIQGDVALTLNNTIPDRIALLRLDTDWYESTRISLERLFPRLEIGGVCILDDYGHWMGARKAVDDYFNDYGFRPLMHPIDFSGRIFLKSR